MAQLALQLLSLGWVLRARGAAAAEAGVLVVYAEPFGPPVGVVRLLPHHRVELSVRPGLEIFIDDVEDVAPPLSVGQGPTPTVHLDQDRRPDPGKGAVRQLCILADHTKWGVVGLSSFVALEGRRPAHQQRHLEPDSGGRWRSPSPNPVVTPYGLGR